MKSYTLIIGLFCVLTIACLVLAQTWGKTNQWAAAVGYLLAMVFSTLALTASYASKATSDRHNQEQK